MQTAKTLIRLGGCPGWSESSLGAHAILLILSWGGSVVSVVCRWGNSCVLHTSCNRRSCCWLCFCQDNPVLFVQNIQRFPCWNHYNSGVNLYHLLCWFVSASFHFYIYVHVDRVKRICVFEHSVMTNFNCACPAIQRGQRSGLCVKVTLDSLLVWASSEGSGETVRMRRLAWTFAARIGNKYQIRLTRPM